MELVCISEVNHNYDVILGDNVKKFLHPGTKVRVTIEEIPAETGDNRNEIIENLKKISLSSSLGIINSKISREDAHERF